MNFIAPPSAEGVSPVQPVLTFMREVRLLVPDRIAALLPKSSKNGRSAISEVQDRMVQLSREAIAAEKKL
jgi:hypothetical protein